MAKVLELSFSITVQTYILESEAGVSERAEAACWGRAGRSTQIFRWLLVFSVSLLLLFFVFLNVFHLHIKKNAFPYDLYV